MVYSLWKIYDIVAGKTIENIRGLGDCLHDIVKDEKYEDDKVLMSLHFYTG